MGSGVRYVVCLLAVITAGLVQSFASAADSSLATLLDKVQGLEEQQYRIQALEQQVEVLKAQCQEAGFPHEIANPTIENGHITHVEKAGHSDDPWYGWFASSKSPLLISLAFLVVSWIGQLFIWRAEMHLTKKPHKPGTPQKIAGRIKKPCEWLGLLGMNFLLLWATIRNEELTFIFLGSILLVKSMVEPVKTWFEETDVWLNHEYHAPGRVESSRRSLPFSLFMPSSLFLDLGASSFLEALARFALQMLLSSYVLLSLSVRRGTFDRTYWFWSILVQVLMKSGMGRTFQQDFHVFAKMYSGRRWRKVDEQVKHAMGSEFGAICRAEIIVRALMSIVSNGVVLDFVLYITPLVLMTGESKMDVVKDCLALSFIPTLDDKPTNEEVIILFKYDLGDVEAIEAAEPGGAPLYSKHPPVHEEFCSIVDVFKDYSDEFGPDTQFQLMNAVIDCLRGKSKTEQLSTLPRFFIPDVLREWSTYRTVRSGGDGGGNMFNTDRYVDTLRVFDTLARMGHPHFQAMLLGIFGFTPDAWLFPDPEHPGQESTIFDKAWELVQRSPEVASRDIRSILEEQAFADAAVEACTILDVKFVAGNGIRIIVNGETFLEHEFDDYFEAEEYVYPTRKCASRPNVFRGFFGSQRMTFHSREVSRH